MQAAEKEKTQKLHSHYAPYTNMVHQGLINSQVIITLAKKNPVSPKGYQKSNS